ncbi:respiratory burst oxidase protein B [Trifolium repens]|nr:respiratory burst oxidase protein B [Trifolium repens]
MVNDLGILLLHEPTHSTRGDSRYLSQMLSIKLKATYETYPVRKKYRDIIYFMLDIRYSFKGKLRDVNEGDMLCLTVSIPPDFIDIIIMRPDIA